MDLPRLAVVGVGRWGRRYVDTISRTGLARLAAVVSTQAADGFDLAVAVHPNVEALARHRADFDGAVVACPAAAQPAIAEQLVRAGVPVLLQKPLSPSIEAAEWIRSSAEQTGVLVMVDHTQLFTPAFVELRQRVAGQVLEIMSAGGADGPINRTVGPLWDWGPHDVSMSLALTGERPARATADIVDRLDDDRVTYRADLWFANGSQATVRFGNAMEHKTRHLRVRTSEAIYELDGLSPRPLTVRDRRGGRPQVIATANVLPLDRVVGEFARALQDRSARHPSLDLGVDVVTVLTECERSAGSETR